MKIHKVVIALIIALVAVNSAFAFTFSPMTVTITPTAPGNIVSFRVENESPTPIAVIVRAVTRVSDIEGQETNDPVTKEFVIFPARVVVQANSYQTVKVQWKGTANPVGELAYRIVAEQVPVDFTRDQTSGVKVVFRYLAALYVAPKSVAAKVKLGSLTGAVRNGVNGLVVQIRNDGNRHALLFSSILKFQAPTQLQQIELSGKDMEAIEGMNVLAGSTRNFFVPWASATDGTIYEGSFSSSIE